MKKNLLNLKTAVLGLGMLISVTANALTYTATVSGNWSSGATWGGTAPTGAVSGDDIVIASGVTVDLDVDVMFTGGILLPNTIAVNGTLTSTSNHALTITKGALTGGGLISVKRMAFTNTGTAAFTGTMNVGTLLNSNSALGFAAIANVSDSLILESGILTLNGTADVVLMSNSTVRVGDGSLLLNGGGTFNTSNNYNVMYVGTSKTSGLELNGTTVQNVSVNLNSNTETLTLNNDLTANGNLTFSNGKMNLNGRKLTIMGDLTMSSSNSFVSNNMSDLAIMGSGNLTSGLTFDSGSSLHDLTINRSGSTVKLMSNVSIDGHLNLMNGSYSIENGSNMTMNAGSTIHLEGGSMTTNSGNFIGTAAYNVEYMGNSNSNGGTELTGSGLNNVTINYLSNSPKVTLNSDLTVAGQLSLMNGNLDLNGKNMTLNGTMSQSTLNSTFIGNANSDLTLNLTSSASSSLSFDQSNNNLHKLMINLSSSTSSIMVATALTINSELHFAKGKLVLGNTGDLTIMSTGTITGYDNNNYVVTTTSASNTSGGRLLMNVNSGSSDWVTFPVGTQDNYSPAYIQQTSTGTSGNFMVKTVGEFLDNGTTGTDLSTSTSMVKRTWHVEAASGVNVNMNLKLGWMSSTEVNGFNRTSAMLRHYTNSAWDVTAATSATAGANGTFELSRDGITSLSPFAVTDANTTVGIKQIAANTINLQVYPNPAKDAISVKSPNASATCKYEVVDITGRTILTVSNDDAVNKFDVSKLEKGFYFVKVTDTTSNVTGTKRFVKE